MKIKVAVEAKVSADRKRCLETCKHRGWVWNLSAPEPDMLPACLAYNVRRLEPDTHGRPLRCRACLRAEVPR